MAIQELLLGNYDRLKNNPTYINQLRNNLICPNCLRIVPNKEHFIKNGCKWCLKKDEQN
jgi:hypothetical protein